MPKHDIKVKLIGEDGNAFHILGKVMRKLRDAGLSEEEVNAYYAEATSSDYDHLLATTAKWVRIK